MNLTARILPLLTKIILRQNDQNTQGNFVTCYIEKKEPKMLRSREFFDIITITDFMQRGYKNVKR